MNHCMEANGQYSYLKRHMDVQHYNTVGERYKCYCGQRTAGGTGTGYRDISSNVSIVDPPSANTRHSFLSPNPINLPILTLYRGLSRHTARHATLHCSGLQLWHRCIFINIHYIWKRHFVDSLQAFPKFKQFKHIGKSFADKDYKSLNLNWFKCESARHL